MDAIRGVAALAVFLSHWRDSFLVDYPQAAHKNLFISITYFATGLGHEAVMVFFVLSGYLVGGSVLRQFRLGTWSWARYLFARLTRLYMVLVPALLLGLFWDSRGLHLFGLSGVYGGHGGHGAMGLPDLRQLSVPVLLGNYLFLQGILVPTFGTNGPLWSLSYELWYYVAFPLLAIVGLRGGQRKSRVIALVSVLLLGAFVGSSIIFYFLIWLMGAALPLLPPPPKMRGVGRWATWLLALAAIAAALAWDKVRHPPMYLSDLLLGLSIAVLVYVMRHMERESQSRVYRVVARHMAESSYTLYLVHVPLLVFLIASLPPGRIQPAAGLDLLKVLALGLATLLYAQLVWWLFEARTERVRAALARFFWDDSKAVETRG